MSALNYQIHLKHFSLGLVALTLLANSLFAFALASFSVIHDFIGIDGTQPNGFLVQGQDGWLYGTANRGTGGSTASPGGVAFKIKPDGTSYTIIHTFIQGINEGKFPVGGLSLGRDGNFYGVTTSSAVLPDGSIGRGAIFKMTPSGDVTALHTFSSTPITEPHGALSAPTEGPDGNLYGTTREGGDSNVGIIYKLNPSNGDFTKLYHFKDDHIDGIAPRTSLIFGADGMLYGTTPLGGRVSVQPDVSNRGTVFKINPDGTGYQVIHNFDSTHGLWPNGQLLQGNDGIFYGTTERGGAENLGTVFKLTPQGNITILKDFLGPTFTADGAFPTSGLVQGADGNFYGTTNRGGPEGMGVVFQITPQGIYSVLHQFIADTDGSLDINDNDNLTLHTNGMLYGAAKRFGPSTPTEYHPYGTLFRLDISASASTNPVSVPMLPELAFLVLFGALGFIGIKISKSKTHH